jgi:hypothetical protein
MADANHNAALEQMVDAHGLDAILIALSDICTEKAEQLRQNRQGDPSAMLFAEL